MARNWCAEYAPAALAADHRTPELDRSLARPLLAARSPRGRSSPAAHASKRRKQTCAHASHCCWPPAQWYATASAARKDNSDDRGLANSLQLLAQQPLEAT